MNFRKVILLSLLALPVASGSAGAVAFTQRHSHTSTLLADGNLLFIGGVTDAGNTTTTSVQMYNMSTNKFEDWGGLVTARSSHTATLMSDGRILVAGGFNSANTPINSLEICDPVAKTCASAGVTMSTARGGHTATLLSSGLKAGQVLICGGQTALAATSVTGSCDLFNPVGPARTAAAPLVSPRMGHAAVLMNNGKVFATGGRRLDSLGTTWVYEPTNEIYSPDLDVWTPVSALQQGRINHTVTVLSNGLVAVGGGYNPNYTDYLCKSVHNATCGVTRNTEECWCSDDALFWGYPQANQDMGPHGYLDGAEIFDQNGARTVLGESTYGVSPFRLRDHASLLLPDGSWNIFGGYGGIVRTIFAATPALNNGAVFYLTRTGAQSAAIKNTSVVNFPVTVKLSRPIDGRFVNGDAFFAKPLSTATPSVTIDSARFYLTHSTAPLDGLTADYDKLTNNSYLNTNLQLKNPSGTATFDKTSSSSDPDTYPVGLTVITSTLTFATVYPGDQPKPVALDMAVWVGLLLPDTMRGIRGTVNITAGTMPDPAKKYSVSFDPVSAIPFNYVYAPSMDDGTSGLFVTSITFTGTALISNLTDDTTIYSPLHPNGNPIKLQLGVTYTADEVYALQRKPTFVYGRSDLVIREMISSSNLRYFPSTNLWDTTGDVMTEPIFNQTALVTPAADAVMIGGRNCEANPANDCLRTVKTFTARIAGNAYIPVYKATDGSSDWPQGTQLNSKRASHTSTLLRDGSILTCGGSDGTKMLSSCELMDPATKMWSYTNPMNYARTRHTATLLPNGNVLVAGGATPSSAAVNTAEIFYPDTKLWVLTSQMSSPRQNHTATLLPDGNVLVAGGATLSTYSATAEIYISSISTWQNVLTPMVNARAQHTATLLKNGDVLLAGGVNGYGATATTDIYNFAARSFAAGPSMNIGRYAHTANLLRDGRVLVIGGSNNTASQITSEIYDGTTWLDHVASVGDLILNHNRTNHRSVLLPDGKVMVTGGETPGMAQLRNEGYDPDFSLWTDQGKMFSGRENHTTVLTNDNYVLNIGGFDGSNYLNTTDQIYYSYYPDMYGQAADVQRRPVISTSTYYFDRAQAFTAQSDLSNFHGMSEANGGGAGPQNSSASNPRIYLSQIDNPSGFMIDLSTRIYSWYGGTNTSWAATTSSITVLSPALPGEMPYGWYNLRVANNGQFSNGRTVQITFPRPTGLPSVPVGTVLGMSSVTWNWNQGTVPPVPGADGYNIYSATNNVFIGTTAFTTNVTYTQAGMIPNTAASIQVNAYNLGGGGALVKSATFYTLASSPTALTINSASFEHAALSWNSTNAVGTKFELSICAGSNFADPLAISTPIAFNMNYTSTSAALSQLSADTMYYFRVRAINGDGITSPYSNIPSTITVAAINNLTGTAISSSTISWAWGESADSSVYYEIYDVSNGTEAPVYLSSTSFTTYPQQGLSADMPYAVSVRAVKDVSGPVYGPFAYSKQVYTLAVAPTPASGNVFVQVTTGSFVALWSANGNSTATVYGVAISTDSSFPAGATAKSHTQDTLMAFQGLTPNTRYYVGVWATNGNGINTAASLLGSKYTMARPPDSVTPAEISMSGVVLTWSTNKNNAATIYEVRMATDSLTGGNITTYVPFSYGYTGNSVKVSGLLTSTSYYFDVAARNGDGAVTSRVQAVPVAFTVAGPEGSPAGSVGGTANPGKTTVISGTLPDNRAVSLTVPPQTFPSATALAISTSATGACGSYSVCGSPIEVALYSENGAQPQEPVTLTLGYGCTIPNITNLVLARYNPVSGQCLPLETTIDPGSRTITATLNHFSVFKLMVKNAASDLSGVVVFPNPFRPNRGNGFVTINYMPANSKVRIYTLSGDKVWEGSASTTGIIIWKGVNKSGQLVASGVYLAVIDSTAGKKVVKLAVER
jgi:hypothetical protein